MLDRWLRVIEKGWLDTKCRVYTGFVASLVVLLLTLGTLPSQADTSTPEQDISAMVWQWVERGDITLGQNCGRILDACNATHCDQARLDDGEVVYSLGNVQITFGRLADGTISLVSIKEVFQFGDPMIATWGNYFVSINGQPVMLGNRVFAPINGHPAMPGDMVAVWKQLPKDHLATLMLIRNEERQTVTMLLTHNLLSE